MSGGQQQRVALARALAVSPSVLLLDEPLSALDAQVRVQLRDEIRRLQLAEGITTLFVTHDQSEALAVADRVAVLNKGRLEQVNTPQEVYGRPSTPFVAAFVGVMNELPVERTGDGRARISTASSQTLQVRPESLVVGAPDGIPGTVRISTFLGPVTRLVIDTAVGELIVDARSGPHLPEIGSGTTVALDLSDPTTP
jgi:putative spermidine/putrescine transport system ATP-binding protein